MKKFTAALLSIAMPLSISMPAAFATDHIEQIAISDSIVIAIENK